ncbi:MAG: helical backbone metal receptor [Desulfobulbaceae bacterium]|nr:helical backbone metal receptor [Desulfobulbaceae bacterium]
MLERIVSLTPSITETIFALGAGHRVVGITDACDFPPEVHTIPHVCSWFDPDMDRIVNLKPDMVLGLATAHQRLAPVFETHGIRLELFNPATVEEALVDMVSMGALLDIPKGSQTLVQALRKRMELLDAQVGKLAPDTKLTVARVLDFNNQNLIVAGPRSFQYDVIRHGGGINVTTDTEGAYPTIPFLQLKSWDPQMIFLCGTGTNIPPRLQNDVRWRDLTAMKTGRIYQFDCGLTCRTGPRIVDMAELLFQTLYT